MTQLNPNWIQALTYSARLDRQVIKASWTEGVLSGMKPSQRALGTNMSIDVAAGTSCIYGDDQIDQGAYLCSTTVFENVVIGAAPGSLSRLDLVYQRVNDPNAGGPAGSTSSFGVVAGTASGSPVLPALPTSAIPIASVAVATGTVAITDAMITSLRVPAIEINGVPPSVPVPFFGPEASLPPGFVLYNGQSLLRDVYWRLFYYLGTTYGAADGTHFNVPDLRGRAPFGLDNMGGSDAGRLSVANTLGLVGGEELHTLITAEMASHSHPISDAGHTHFGSGGGNIVATTLSGGAGPVGSVTVASGSGYIVPYLQAGTGSFIGGGLSTSGAGISTQLIGSGTPMNNMPPYILCNWIARN